MIVLLAALAVACTSDDVGPAFPTDPVQLSEVDHLPASPGDLVTVSGIYFDTPAKRLCGLSLESDPPQCGGFSIGLPSDVEAAFGTANITVRGTLTRPDMIAVHSFTYGDSSKVDDPKWIVVP